MSEPDAVREAVSLSEPDAEQAFRAANGEW
jgi:hypothetical protein